MAQVAKGKTLLTAEIQPGWTVQSDGFGLITSTTTYKADIAAPITAFQRGQPHPDTFYSYLKAHKYQISWDNLRYKTIKVDYVGIDPAVGSGVRTLANTSVANGLTAENITSHTNFFERDVNYTVGPLAGLPSDFGGAYDDSTLGPPVTVIAVAPSPKAGQAVVVPSSEGYNGACFETGMGGRFIGFVDPDVPYLYGKTQYLARTTTYSGVMYTTSQSDVQALYALLGSATGTRSWGVFNLIPLWGPAGTGTYGKQNLLSQVNVEEYGALYKVIYEIRYSKEGWPPDVYTNI
jgi:hypothetical protein